MFRRRTPLSAGILILASALILSGCMDEPRIGRNETLRVFECEGSAFSDTHPLSLARDEDTADFARSTSPGEVVFCLISRGGGSHQFALEWGYNASQTSMLEISQGQRVLVSSSVRPQDGEQFLSVIELEPETVVRVQVSGGLEGEPVQLRRVLVTIPG